MKLARVRLCFFFLELSLNLQRWATHGTVQRRVLIADTSGFTTAPGSGKNSLTDKLLFLENPPEAARGVMDFAEFVRN